ncbi:hypothetical protein ABZ371_00940 [Streptomyces sp. NPDC005899]|uniref:hypothetical protein n=1 Tax=Streptomyces sp. NPDC005899 TaxID=3155716 RepID=UPI0033CE7069
MLDLIGMGLEAVPGGAPPDRWASPRQLDSAVETPPAARICVGGWAINDPAAHVYPLLPTQKDAKDFSYVLAIAAQESQDPEDQENHQAQSDQCCRDFVFEHAELRLS